MKTKAIETRRLGQQVQEVMTTKILEGAYPAGMHLSEINLCTELGVSRTPVREALFKLEEKGLVISHPNRGFFISRQDPSVVVELYPVLASLEALALKTSGRFDASEINQLKKINEKMANKKLKAPALFQMDLDFHEFLVSKCSNGRLLGIIRETKERVRRFDGGYKRGLADQDRAVREHEAIIEALSKGQNNKAARLLEAHWTTGMKTVTKWIDSQDSEGEKHDTQLSA